MDENLKRAAQDGNVSDLYELIKTDGNVLNRIGEVEFIDTPLHIAAAAGRIDFAMEIMSLKPSFARMLNQEGLSPIHLAVKEGHKELVLLLLENSKELVRVKGKNGETPLHYAITRKHNLDLLAKFLEACPECIRDVTTTNQTALHIATRNDELEALKLLCRMLRRTEYGADVANQKDRDGNTVLHIAAQDNRHKMLKHLLKCKADKHATDLRGSTALGVAERCQNKESIRILRGYFIPCVSTFYHKLQNQISKYVTKASTAIFQDMDNISIEHRNALLVILGLLLTATYQACLSPPGGVWQGDSSSNPNFTVSVWQGNSSSNPNFTVSVWQGDSSSNPNFTVSVWQGNSSSNPNFTVSVWQGNSSSNINLTASVWQGNSSSNSNSTATERDDEKKAGKSVMDQSDFLYFYIPTSAVFLVTFFLTLGLLKPFPRGFRTALQVLLAFLAICFYRSIFFLAPTHKAKVAVNVFSALAFVSMMFMSFADRMSKISALILGCWLFTTGCLFDKTIVISIFGCLLFIFLYDEFWKGTPLVVGFCLLVGLSDMDVLALKRSLIVLGCWLFLSLCQFCIKRCNKWLSCLHYRNACHEQN